MILSLKSLSKCSLRSYFSFWTQIFNLLLLSAVLTNCAFAPLSDPVTPQTLGKGNQSHSLTVGYPYVGYVYTMGVGDTFDLGLQMESQIKGFSMGSRIMIQATDYAEDQWSGSLLAGGGLTTQGAYGYGGMVWGRRFGFYELTFVPRFNYTNISRDPEADVIEDFEDLYSIRFTETGDYYYASLTISNTFWFRPSFGFSLVLGGAYIFPWGDSGDSKFVAPYGGIGMTFK
jgi:hypothetical protein